jgi:hypothetical protein
MVADGEEAFKVSTQHHVRDVEPAMVEGVTFSQSGQTTCDDTGGECRQ